MRLRMATRLVRGLLVAISATGLAVSAEAQEKKLKIGVIYDLTGPLAGGLAPARQTLARLFDVVGRPRRFRVEDNRFVIGWLPLENEQGRFARLLGLVCADAQVGRFQAQFDIVGVKAPRPEQEPQGPAESSLLVIHQAQPRDRPHLIRLPAQADEVLDFGFIVLAGLKVTLRAFEAPRRPRFGRAPGRQQPEQRAQNQKDEQVFSHAHYGASPFRNQSSSKRKGTSDKAKKIGPPRWWRAESIRPTSMWTHSMASVKTRNPFSRIPSGMTNRANTHRRQALRKELARHKARDQQDQAGVNPAALLRHAERNAGQLEHQPVPQQRHPRHEQHHVRHVG